MSTSTAPGWYPDPLTRHEYRYFDGGTWSEHVSNGGIQAVDPLEGGDGSAADDGIEDAEIVVEIEGEEIAVADAPGIVDATVADSAERPALGAGGASTDPGSCDVEG